MDIKKDLFVRAHALNNLGRHSDADLMIRAARAIELYESGFCPYCGNPLSKDDTEKTEGEV